MSDKKATETEIIQRRKSENESARKAAVEKLKAENEIARKEAAEKRKAGDESTYNPYENRDVPHSCNYCQSMANMVKGAIGTGILAMPEAFKNAGSINGLVVGFLIGIFMVYTMHLLINVQYRLCKRFEKPLLQYSECIKYAVEVGPLWVRKGCMRKALPVLADVLLCVFHLGIMCAYQIFVAVNIKAVVEHYSNFHIHVGLWVAIFFIVFFAIALIPSLSILSYFAWFANIVSFVTYGIGCYFIFCKLPNIQEREKFQWASLPLYVGTLLFSVLSIGLIVTIEAEMKQPAKFVSKFGVLNVSLFVVLLLYLAFGFCGYWKYGALVEGTITLNFDQKHFLANGVRVIYCLAIFISFGLQAYVVYSIIWEKHLKNKINKHHVLGVIIFKFLIIVITGVIGAFLPYVGIIISLSGSFCLPTLAFMLPGFMSICINYPDNYGKMKWRLTKDILIIIAGFIGFLTGTYCGVLELIVKTKKANKK